MATPKLVEADVAVGQEASPLLWDDPILRPTALAWLYNEDAEEWRFLVATESVRTDDPRRAYHRIRNILKKAKLLDRLPLRRVVVTDPSNGVLSAVARAIQPPFESATIYDCIYFGVHIPGMFVYRLDPDRGSSGKPSTKSHAHSAGSGD